MTYIEIESTTKRSIIYTIITNEEENFIASIAYASLVICRMVTIRYIIVKN